MTIIKEARRAMDRLFSFVVSSQEERSKPAALAAIRAACPRTDVVRYSNASFSACSLFPSEPHDD